MPEFPTYEQLIGGTPLVNLNSMLSEEATARGVTLLGKAEFLNPGFSQKDRIARKIFDEAEKSGALKPGGTVIAASSGNTGAAAAMMGAMRGYKVIIVTNSKCSQEKMDRCVCARVYFCPAVFAADRPLPAAVAAPRCRLHRRVSPLWVRSC
jgi:cysteine synthase